MIESLGWFLQDFEAPSAAGAWAPHAPLQLALFDSPVAPWAPTYWTLQELAANTAEEPPPPGGGSTSPRMLMGLGS